MARGVTRVSRSAAGNESADDKGGNENDNLLQDAQIGADEAVVGGTGDDGGVVIDDRAEDESWDLPDGAKPATRQQTETRQQDRPPSQEDDDPYGEDDRLAQDEGADGYGDRGPSRRARRNRARRAALDGASQHIEMLQRTVMEQGEMLKRLTSGQMGIAAHSVDSQLGQAQQALRMADAELAKAVSEGDGGKFAEIQALRDEAYARVIGLTQQKRRIEAQRAQGFEEQPGGGQRSVAQPDGRQQQALTPQQQAAAEKATNYAEIFMDRFSWYDPQGGGRDNNIVRTIYAELSDEGYLDHTPLKWKEMERRLREDYGIEPDGVEARGGGEDGEDFPRQRQPATVRQPSRSGPPTASVRGTRSANRGGFRLDENMVDILRSEGLLGEGLSKEDKEKRDRIISRWKAGSKQLRTGAAR